jgi:hypothetical protein
MAMRLCGSAIKRLGHMAGHGFLRKSVHAHLCTLRERIRKGFPAVALPAAHQRIDVSKWQIQHVGGMVHGTSEAVSSDATVRGKVLMMFTVSTLTRTTRLTKSTM